MDAGGAKMAEYLRGTYAPSIDEVLDVPIAPAEKALSLISLSDKFPENKTKYLELATKLNAFPGFPSREIERSIQERLNK